MGSKYEFTGETLKHEGHTLHRIRRLSDGKLGGWIKSEENLSQEGDCWVDVGAKVYEDARVYGNALVYGNATICDSAQVYGNAKIYGDAWVYDDAKVYGHAEVYENGSVKGNAKVYNSAKVYGEAYVGHNAEVFGNAKIYYHASVYGNAKVYGSAEVFGGNYCCIDDNAQVYDNAKVYDSAQIYNDAQVYGNAHIYGWVKICGNAKVFGNARIHFSCREKIECPDQTTIDSGKYTGEDYEEDYDEDYNENNLLDDNVVKEVVQDFIYKVDDSNKLTTQTEYDSVDEFFNEPVTSDIKLDTLIICAVDTKQPLIKLQKVEVEDKTEFKFIVEITNEDGDDFVFRSIIKSQDQLNQLIQQTIDALKNYPKFIKYADDLEEYI